MYLHVFTRPGDNILRLSGLRNQVRSAYPLGDAHSKLHISHSAGVTSITVPDGGVQEADMVIVAEISGALETEPVIVTQGSDVGFDLDYMTAVTAGRETI